MTQIAPCTARPALAAAAAVLIALSGCGGGGGETAPPPPPAATTVDLSGIAADGPLQGATACYDLNDDGVCDAGEPTAVTNADGKFTLTVAIAEGGRHRVIVDVPATAIDKDTGAAVGSAFTMVAPATGSSAAAIVATPLSTLVVQHMDTTGATMAAAADHIRAQAGLAVSPLADYTAAANADNRQAGMVARLVVLTSQQQRAAVASVQGSTDLSGTVISAADLTRAVAQAVISALPGVAAAVADPAITGASGAALQTALAAAATGVVAQTGLTAQTVAAAIGVAKLPGDGSPDAPTAAASLTALRYTSANSWFMRTLEASAADNTPDAAGKLRYYSVYRESVPDNANPVAVVNAWGAGPTLARAGDLHWDGSAWVACTLGTRGENTRRDAQGRSTYSFCGTREDGSSRRSAVDLAGKSIAAVLRDTIRTFPGGANGVNYADWGAADLGVYGSAVFPANAKLFYQTNTITRGAFTYDVQAANAAVAYTAAVAAGGDARSTTPACAAVTSTNSAGFITPVTSLEDLVARNPGKPCVFNAGSNADGSSGASNAWWSSSTASIGTVAGTQALPAGTGTYYTTTGVLRVAFTGSGSGSGNGVTFLHCQQRRADGSVRNCSAIGIGTYAIQTLADGRVMTFSALPALAQRLGSVRVFVERAGKVYFGFTSQPGSVNSIRLNLEAANALVKPLGLPPIAPVARAADFSAAQTALLATARGVYGTAGDTEAVVVRFGDGGRFVLGDVEPPSGREQSGSERGSLQIDPATGAFAALLDVDSNGTLGTSHPSETSKLTISASQILRGDGSITPRFSTASTGIVGLWALGSATDLAANHFAFFANGKVLHVDTVGEDSGACAQARQGPAGAEYARYSFDAATGALRVFGKLYDTNGCAGLFDSSAGAVQAGTANTEFTATVVMAADGRTASIAVSGEPVMTLYRIAAQ